MHILVNATSARLGGGITVIRNLLPAFLAQDGGQNRYTVIALDEAAAAMDPRDPRVELVSFRHKGLGARLFWEQLSLPARALAGGVDLVFSPANVAVVGSTAPQVLMFQNMAPFDPGVISRAGHGARRRRLSTLRWLSIASARAARRLVFISRFAQRSILPQLGVSALLSDCIYLGRDPSFTPLAKARSQEARERLGLNHPYLLTVSHFYHYKNFVELVHGFARARPQLPPELTLVIAGGEHDRDYAARVRAAIDQLALGDSVRLLGEVPYADLPPLYAAASTFVFPSSCENFPNILVEGMASGAPTLASRVGPMQEIAGEGAAYFDPFDPDDIARALVRLWSDPAEQGRLRAAALARVARYSWDETARGLLAVFDRAVRRQAA